MQPANIHRKSGSALIVVLWILIIVALIVSTFAFEMRLEAKVITLQRARFKADQLALAGIELAKSMLNYKEKEETKGPIGEKVFHEEPWLNNADKINGGIPVDFNEPLGDGTVRLHIDYENGRRNISTLTSEEWHEIFKQAGIPNTSWDSLLGCLADWQDANDEHGPNGAESDDPFYRERGYKCKNKPVDTVDELLLIKGWTPEILYGTPPSEKTREPIAGIAKQLTTWGNNNKINPNSASSEVLNSLNIPDAMIDAILETRLGPDGKPGTADDGITDDDLKTLHLDPVFALGKPEYVAITSIGEVGDIRSKISCIFKLGEKQAVPLFWIEGK